MQSPLFGKLYLVPHVADEQPDERTIGYVDFGDDTRLIQGLWLGEGWLNRKGKPFADPIARWYHAEKPDGSRPF